MSKQIKNVEFLSVEFSFYCEVPDGCLNLGILKLECQGRTFELDTVRSEWLHVDNGTTVRVDLEVDEDVSDTCKFDLTKEDMDSDDLKIDLWFDVTEGLEDGYVDPDSVTLFVKHINPDGSGCTIAMDINLD